MGEDWNKNSKYILTKIDDLSESQKKSEEMQQKILDKLSNNTNTLSSQESKCSKNFVSQWALGIIISLIISVSGFGFYNSSSNDNRFDSKISQNYTEILQHKVVLNKLEEEMSELIAEMQKKGSIK